MTNPILVFDSGIGGISVLEEIRKQLPDHDYVYLFDNARLPYGELEEQELKSGAIKLITETAKQYDAILVVVACNTASTVILPKLRSELSIPIVGVVPAIKPASEQTRTKHIALLATPATVTREYTKSLINSYAKECSVDLIASSQLVQAAEAKLRNEPVSQNQIDEIVKPIVDKNIDTLVLGCTHFPLLKEELSKSLGNEVKLLDSGKAIANRVAYLLQHNEMKQVSQSKSMITGIYTSHGINEALRETLISKGFNELKHYK